MQQRKQQASSDKELRERFRLPPSSTAPPLYLPPSLSLFLHCAASSTSLTPHRLLSPTRLRTFLFSPSFLVFLSLPAMMAAEASCGLCC